MAPSGYLQVGSPKQRKRIVRPGAANLHLPLIERRSQTKDESEENLLTLASSQWTISAAPISSTSVYSQASYVMSPLVFSENKLDRRRFGIAETPAQEGPWSRPKHAQSAASSIFPLDLKSAMHNKNPFVGEDEAVNNRGDIEYPPSGDIFAGSAAESPKTVPETSRSTSEAANVRLKKLRMSTRVLGKILSRLSVHQSSSRHANVDETPLLPPKPPQVLISPSSAGIEIPSPLKENSEEDHFADKDALRPFVPEKIVDIPRKLPARPSTWKPHRPPSPFPKSLRRHRKRKNEASALVVTLPPPLPTRHKIASTVLADHQPAFLSFSAPPTDTLDMTTTSPVWADIQMRLKAGAIKSSVYAIHDCGIISPTSSCIQYM